jgi:hypothetical protein
LGWGIFFRPVCLQLQGFLISKDFKILAYEKSL